MRCSAPPGKVIDCKATSIVFPAHDGMVGILCDHMPMFCELGLGMMEVEYTSEETAANRSTIRRQWSSTGARPYRVKSRAIGLKRRSFLNRVKKEKK